MGNKKFGSFWLEKIRVSIVMIGDNPYCNPNLTLDREDFEIKV